MICQICRKRKGKRDCLAVRELICNECCGRKRRRLIQCPDNCQYLKRSQDYLKGKELSESEVKIRKTFPGFFQRLEEKIIELQRMRFPDLTDGDVKEALEQNLSNLNLKKKVIIYEYKSVNPKVQVLSDTISELLNSFQSSKSEPRILGGAGEKETYDLETIIFLLKVEVGLVKRLVEEGKGETYYLDLINTWH